MENDAEITPQEIMILAIHRRAPTLSKIKLDGTSNNDDFLVGSNAGAARR